MRERRILGKVKQNVIIKQDEKGNKIVFIRDILFAGKRKIDWKQVKEYLKQNTVWMQNMDGIVILQDLRYQFIMKREKLCIIIFFVQKC